MNQQKKIGELSRSLYTFHQECGPTNSFRLSVKNFLSSTLAVLFPHFAECTFRSPKEIQARLNGIVASLDTILKFFPSKVSKKKQREEDEIIISDFIENLGGLRDSLWLDAKAIYDGDPAAYNVDEVILAYPGFYAICVYRIAHEFYRMNVPIFPRMLTEQAHQITGIDIHPGAQIGKSFFIDHGTGIVIGETTEIAAHVKLYQGVTLGALSVDKSQSSKKRHPTIEENVVIYSNATILGGSTIIGRNSIIGGNVWITSSVAPHSVAYHSSKISVRTDDRKVKIKKVKSLKKKGKLHAR